MRFGVLRSYVYLLLQKMTVETPKVVKLKLV